MSLREIFADHKEKFYRLQEKRSREGSDKIKICPVCGTTINHQKLEQFRFVCSRCGHYFPMTAAERIELICDPNSFREAAASLVSKDPLEFPGYEKRLKEATESTKLCDAVKVGVAAVKKMPAAFAVMDSRFFMGSMGTVVGEKITALAEYAAKKDLPLIIYSASGGARMQEGMFSLMQMAKTSAAIERYKRRGGLFISVLTHPTTGGVSASFASLGDIIIAEPKALICFAGPRVIEQTIGGKLPEGFQRAEFLQDHGMIDMIAERLEQRELLGRILKLHGRGAEHGENGKIFGLQHSRSGKGPKETAHK